ncbi:MAG TPA: ferredoxin--NADP reductase [Pirellulales bacterium]|nr:ferredoxin--NADP reductase [Pirellulales bacterium]
MTSPPAAQLDGKLVEGELQRLRSEFYNASVVEVRDAHEELRILRVRPDGERVSLQAGQYATLGLGSWEACIAGSHDAQPVRPQLIRRAYSVACSMLDESSSLVRLGDCEYLEFYVALVRGKSPELRLTPRLFRLQPGDRLYLGPHAHGRYTLAGVQPGDRVVFAATGTGEAPHNAMLAELLASGPPRPIASVTCVRYRKDLAYLRVHRELERRFAKYRYLGLTTREPENVDPQASGYVGKRYLQEYFESGDFERDSGIVLDPKQTHVYLSGNPAMVGLPTPGAASSGSINGMVAILQRRGFRLDEPDCPGNLHCERFW